MMRYFRAAIALALGWSMLVATPAAAAGVITVELDGRECGIVRVTAHNGREDAAEYRIQTGFDGIIVFPIAAGETREHRIRVADGARVSFFSPDTGSQGINYDAADGCRTADPKAGPQASCVNNLVTVSNFGSAPAEGIRILAGGAEVLPPTTIAPDGIRGVIVTPQSPQTEVQVEIQQQAADPTGVFFQITRFTAAAEPAACRGHAATIEDTCTGIRLGVVFPDGPSDLERLVVDPVLPQGDAAGPFDVPAPGQRLDVPLPANRLVQVSFFFPARFLAAFHRHTRPASCTPPSSSPPGPSLSSPPSPDGPPSPSEAPPSPVAPPSPATPTGRPGSGGGLPVTGAATATAAAVGVGLLVLGALTLVVRRRRLAR